MTSQTGPVASGSERRSRFWVLVDNFPPARAFNNLKISYKLVIGFGLLLLLILIGAAISFESSRSATARIRQTTELRVPIAIKATEAQVALLTMLGDIQSYLVLGDTKHWDDYQRSEDSFVSELDELERRLEALRATTPGVEDTLSQLQALRDQYANWTGMAEELFVLRNDRLAREPAFRILATSGTEYGGQIMIDTQRLIELQAIREPSAQNFNALKDMADFQASFAAMLAGLRNYVATRDRDFKGEYESNLDLNEVAWHELMGNRTERLTAEQQALLDDIATNRESFLELPDQVFQDLEGPRWREDLFVFQQDAAPTAGEMRRLLKEIRDEQVDLMNASLQDGVEELRSTQNRALFGGVVAVLMAVWLTLVFRHIIARPIVRLTHVAERIRAGNLEAQAQVEHNDEIGTLARTFNRMTTQLRETLTQVRTEKKRADDLLNVVIPIGVKLASETDFNRLIENILVEAKSFCHAQGGILYLLRREEESLEFVIVRNDSQGIALGGTTGKEIPFPALSLAQNGNGHTDRRDVAAQAALSGRSVNIADASSAEGFDFSAPKELEFPQQNGDRTSSHAISFLAIPLKNNQQEVIGVLELLNAQETDRNVRGDGAGQVIPFDANLQQMMESYSSLAVAALEAYIREAGLRREIQQLRIEIDEAKRQQQVDEIVNTDFFQELQAQAGDMRRRSERRARHSRPDRETGSDEVEETETEE